MNCRIIQELGRADTVGDLTTSSSSFSTSSSSSSSILLCPLSSILRNATGWQRLLGSAQYIRACASSKLGWAISR
jgi:hypothetical protein